MKRITGILCLLLLLSAPAFADEGLRNAMQDLKKMCEKRADNLETDGTVPKESKKEYKSLVKCANFAGQYDGSDDKKSLKGAGKAVKFAEKAKTLDADVLAALDSVKDSYSSLADAAKLAAQAKGNLLTVLKNIGKFDKTSGKATAAFDKAADLWTTKAAKAIASYIKAITTWSKAETQAVKFRDKEIEKGGLPTGISVNPDGSINNSTGQPIQLTDICFDLRITVKGTGTNKAKGCATDNAPGAFPVTWPAGGTFVGRTFLPIPPEIPGFPVTFKGSVTYKTNVGDLKVEISRK